jgi:heme/copper-type cytochrome/quinol oxidase subunit 4
MSSPARGVRRAHRGRRLHRVNSRSSFHEDFNRAHQTTTLSNRAFGVVLAIALVAVGLWPLIHRSAPRWWAIGAAAALAAVAVIRAPFLGPLNRTWARVTLLIHGVVSFVIMALVFYTVVTPTALVRRAIGKDPLRRKLNASAPTYWIPRPPSSNGDTDMRRQF